MLRENCNKLTSRHRSSNDDGRADDRALIAFASKA
jgi:hypothetical protein